MSDDIKSATRDEGGSTAAGVFERFNPGSVPPDHDGASAGSSRTEAPSPDIEAEPGQDPQAPNRKGEG